MIIAGQETFAQNAARDDPAVRLCRRLAFDLLRRNCRKYSKIVIALFLGNWRVERWRLRLIRVSYLYFRYLDDVVDGDLTYSVAPRALLDEQLFKWRSGVIGCAATHEANILFHYLWNEFEHRALPLSRLRFLGESILNGIECDLERRVNRQVLSRAQLQVYYANVVLAPAQMAHTILNAQIAIPALEQISITIGRLQSARDLHSDWRNGLINVPLEDLDDVDDVARPTLPPKLESWRKQEIEQCAHRLCETWENWRSLAGNHSRQIMSPAVGTLLNWAARHSRRQRVSR